MTATAPPIHINGSYSVDDVHLFGPLDLTLNAGCWTCVLGRSGVGKSTLLRLTAGLECGGVFQGTITTSDQHTVDQRVSFMAQSDLLLPWLTVLENTVLGARLRGQQPDLPRAQNLLERVGLADHLTKKPRELSGGMRQRTALARTLMEDRPIVLLGAPFSALDASSRAEMQELAAEVLIGKTVLLVTHDPTEAVLLGHQIIVLTRTSIQQWPVPANPPIRDPFAPDTLTCQTELLSVLRGLKRASWVTPLVCPHLDYFRSREWFGSPTFHTSYCRCLLGSPQQLRTTAFCWWNMPQSH